MVITTTSNNARSFTCKAELYDNGQLKVIAIRKLSRSQYHNDLNHECVSNEEDAKEKLRDFVIREANSILEKPGTQNFPIRIVGDFSACR